MEEWIIYAVMAAGAALALLLMAVAYRRFSPANPSFFNKPTNHVEIRSFRRPARLNE